LLLDEPTSALDLASAKRILANVRKAYPELTLVVVMHQLELARQADTVFVMEDGQLAELPQQRVTLARGGIDPALLGDVALQDGRPKLHLHVVVGRRDGRAMGGHLLSAIVRPTLEVLLVDSPRHLRREIDAATGLALIRI